MGDCRDHPWRLALTEKSTGPLLKCTWVCPCGAYKVIEQNFDANVLDMPLSEQLIRGRLKRQRDLQGAQEEAEAPLID